MILTGPEIIRRHETKEIIISPFRTENVNPNSYNFCLGQRMIVYSSEIIDPRVEQDSEEILIGEEGYILQPRKLYLACTEEVIGSKNFVPTYSARSSIARLGLFINLSASLGDIGFIGQWTIQLFALHPIRVYSGMQIGQMMFWHTNGEIDLYRGKYQGASGALASRIHLDFDKKQAEVLYSKEEEVLRVLPNNLELR